jgi:hypothetical protein
LRAPDHDARKLQMKEFVRDLTAAAKLLKRDKIAA